jgi:alpha-D-xyloside xylohydrolase
MEAQVATATIRLSFSNTRQKPDQLEFNQFSRDGVALAPSDVEVRTLGEGIREISASSSNLASWEFHLHESRLPVYGFGERFNSLNQLNQILMNESGNHYGAKGSGSYMPIPFFMDLRGYGVWVDTYSEAVFDLGITNPGEFIVRFRDIHLRVLFFEGPQFALILERFTGIVGRPRLPPYWAFAPWKSRNWHPNMEAVYEDIEKYRQLGLPASVLVLDSPWATNYNTFEINRLQFTSPEKMIQRIHDLGFKLCLWMTPFINAETLTPTEPELVGKIPLTAASNFEEARKAGYFLKNKSGDVYLVPWWKGTGGLIDFTNPAAVQWWKNQVRKAIRLGADAFKADGGEGNYVGDGVFSDGEDAVVMRTHYPVLYHKAVEDLVESDLHGDGVLLIRSGSVGDHNLPFLWAGDNESNFSVENGLPGVVLAGLNAGLSGIPFWTSDLGGYVKRSRTPGDDVLFIRWTEFSAFSPVMLLHSGINLGPWDYGDQALDIFRKYSRLHMSLFPYRYAAAQESSRRGMPLMRALVLFHPLDAEALETSDEYYFGPDLLVAPVLSSGTQRSVHLPEGEWLDYWSGKHYTGPLNMVVDAPLDQIPIYVKAGTILPKIPEDVMTLVPPKPSAAPPIKSLDDRRVYEIYPGPSRYLEDFEDRQLRLDAGQGTTTLNITGAPAKMTIVWRFQHPTEVRINGHRFDVQLYDGLASVSFTHTAESIVVWPLRQSDLSK